MIFVDFSHLIISCYFAQERELVVTEGDFRKHVLHTLMLVQNRFKHTFGQMVLCCDGKRSWRYEVYPHYKALRKINRADDAIKWKEIDRLNRLIREEIQEHKVFKVTCVPRAEGDDVIAVLASSITEASIIVSEDKDFHQLHKHSYISQYSHRRGSVYRSFSPEDDLKEKIISGDRGDSIPNLHSKDEVFILKERQPMVSAKKFDHYNTNFFIGEGGIPENYRKNFERNQRLINFDFIPEDIRAAILAEFNRPAEKVMLGGGARTLYLVQSGINPNSF